MIKVSISISFSMKTNPICAAHRDHQAQVCCIRFPALCVAKGQLWTFTRSGADTDAAMRFVGFRPQPTGHQSVVTTSHLVLVGPVWGSHTWQQYPCCDDSKAKGKVANTFSEGHDL